MKGIKTGGRTKGTPNKLNSELREVLKTLIDAEIDSVTPLLESLPLKDRLDFIAKVLPYLIPKLESVEQFNNISFTEGFKISDVIDFED